MIATSTCLLFLPGCIVGEMRDDLKGTRASVQNLSDLGPQLKETNLAITQTNTRLDELQKQLTTLQTSVQEIHPSLDAANAKLDESVQQLRNLGPMMASLHNLDETLAALRKMMENIDKAIPFVNFSRGTPPADQAIERQKQTPPVKDPASDTAPPK